MAHAQAQVLQAEHRARELQRQLDAANIMIKALAKRLAEMEFKQPKGGGNDGK
jgi:hypothetical protein